MFPLGRGLPLNASIFFIRFGTIGLELLVWNYRFGTISLELLVWNLREGSILEIIADERDLSLPEMQQRDTGVRVGIAF